MRRIIFGIVVFIFIAWVIAYFLNPSTSPQDTTSSPTSTPGPLPALPETTIEFDGKTYAVSSFSSQDSSKVSLLGNYEKKESSGSIIQRLGCVSAINGGFYSESYKPIGLFVEHGETISSYEENALFNGIFYIVNGSQMDISRSLPETSIDYALQSGPILIENGDILPLTIRDDEFARRSVVFSDTLGAVHFLSVYNPEAPYEGPLLSKLPRLISLYAQTKGLAPINALNLDGGSASYFMNGDSVLSELTPVGSIICLSS